MKLEEMNPLETGWLQESIFHAVLLVPSFRGRPSKGLQLTELAHSQGGVAQSAGIDHSDSRLSEVLSLSWVAPVLQGV